MRYTEKGAPPFTRPDVSIKKEEPGVSTYSPTPDSAGGCLKSETEKVRGDKTKGGSTQNDESKGEVKMKDGPNREVKIETVRSAR